MDLLQSIAPALLMVLGGIITWFIKSKVEELRAVEQRLDEKRREIYSEILDPYIRLFADMKGKDQGRAQENVLRKMLSYEFRKTSFDLNLFGSDEVIAAYNNLMQHTYKAEATGSQDPKAMMRLWGQLLLEIRKSLGNKKTKLSEWDMLSSMIKDIEKLKR